MRDIIKKILKEEYNFNKIYDLIKSYIDFTLAYPEQINEYVPNSHIALKFKEVLQACEKESMYPEIYHQIKDTNGYQKVKDENDFDFIDGLYYKKGASRISFIDHIDDYFNINRLEKDGVEEIHRTYQKLRDKYDIIRNNLMLIDTRIPHEYNMVHKIKQDLITDKIKIK